MFVGLAMRQERYQFPAWIRGRHRGEIRIFLQRPNNIGYIVRDVVHLPATQQNHNGRMRAVINVADHEAREAILVPLGRNLPVNTRAQVFVGLPNGSTFTGFFE